VRVRAICLRMRTPERDVVDAIAKISRILSARDFPMSDPVRSEACRLVGRRQYFGLERLEARGQGRAPLPNLTGADQPESRILRKPRGVTST
jgi:hypothetical protein